MRLQSIIQLSIGVCLAILTLPTLATELAVNNDKPTTDLATMFRQAPCNFDTGKPGGREKWLSGFGDKKEEVSGLLKKIKVPSQKLGLNANDRCRVNFVATTYSIMFNNGELPKEFYRELYTTVLIEYRDYLKTVEPDSHFAELSDQYIEEVGSSMKNDVANLAVHLDVRRRKKIGGSGVGQGVFGPAVVIDNVISEGGTEPTK